MASTTPPSKQLFAVLTGDLVGSSKLPADAREQAVQQVKSLAAEWKASHPDAVVGDLVFFRGDSWQLCLAEPRLALRVALLLRAGLTATGPVLHEGKRLRLDTRVGIGIGTAERLDAAHITESTGPAFSLSGEALDSLKKRCLALKVAPGAGGSAGEAGQCADPHWLSVLERAGVPLLDGHASGWTERECAAVYGALQGWTQEQIAAHPLAQGAEQETPSRQAISKAFSRIGWSEFFEAALSEMEQALHLLDSRNP